MNEVIGNTIRNRLDYQCPKAVHCGWLDMPVRQVLESDCVVPQEESPETEIAKEESKTDTEKGDWIDEVESGKIIFHTSNGNFRPEIIRNYAKEKFFCVHRNAFFVKDLIHFHLQM